MTKKLEFIILTSASIGFPAYLFYRDWGNPVPESVAISFGIYVGMVAVLLCHKFVDLKYPQD